MVLNIAMDGPVGAGKSSIAKAVADRLGILHLDTGAMYRAVGLSAIRAGVDLQDEAAVTAHTRQIDVAVAHSAQGQRTIVNGEDVTDYIRTPEVSMAASTVGKYAGVRREMVAIQQKLAASTPMLVDGRDICVRVLPGATVKLFLTASAEERARRRWNEMKDKPDAPSYEEVLRDLRARDAQDMNREVDPLRPTEDAVIVDSTEMNFEQVVAYILKIVEEKTHE
ncbi:MAG: (d)CMP kinase [Clostridia bacterium]|nr:(d)CMP kinase [Clostridia bacterium]